MDDAVRKAIEEGSAEREKREALERAKVREEAEARIRAHDRSVEHVKALIQRDPSFLFDKIKDAVAKGKSSIVLSGGEDVAEAVRSIDGLSEHHTTGFDNINSDEVKEEWHSVEVTWGKR